MKKLGLLFAGFVLLAACGGGGGRTDTAAGPKCQPSGADVTVTAENTDFSADCLAAPADTEFTVTLENKDADQHNFAIYEKKGGEQLFMGEIQKGPTTSTYKVPAQKKGTYYFQCDVHPEMNGTFEVV